MQRIENKNRLGISESDSDKISQFKSLLQLLELERRTFAKAEVSEGIQQAFSVALKHLSRLSSKDVLALYGRSLPRPKKTALQMPSVEKLSTMSLEQIESLVADEATPRRLLEEIAVTRFNFPRGSLRSLANIKLLKEKLNTRIRNERAHGVISSVAQRTK